MKYYNAQFLACRCQQAGVDTPPTQDGLDAAIRRLYRQLKTLRNVSEVVGLSKAEIRCHLHDMGEPLRRRGGANQRLKRYPFQGESLPLEAWISRFGLGGDVTRACIRSRLKGGWDMQAACQCPKGTRRVTC